MFQLLLLIYNGWPLVKPISVWSTRQASKQISNPAQLTAYGGYQLENSMYTFPAKKRFF